MITEFSKKVGIPVENILGGSRKAEIVAARHTYWKMLRDVAGFTFEEIAGLCDVEHSTVLHGVRMATERIEIGDRIAVDVWERVRGLVF